MARPAPDPERVVAVYEKAALRNWPYRRIVEWTGEEWGADEAISLGTVSTWVRQGHEWWTQAERLSTEEEYGLHRQVVGKLLEWIMDDRMNPDEKRGAPELGLKDTVELTLKVLERHAKLTRVDLTPPAGTDGPGITPEQYRATEALRRRVQGQDETRVIEG